MIKIFNKYSDILKYPKFRVKLDYKENYFIVFFHDQKILYDFNCNRLSLPYEPHIDNLVKDWFFGVDKDLCLNSDDCNGQRLYEINCRKREVDQDYNLLINYRIMMNKHSTVLPYPLYKLYFTRDGSQEIYVEYKSNIIKYDFEGNPLGIKSSIDGAVKAWTDGMDEYWGGGGTKPNGRILKVVKGDRLRTQYGDNIYYGFVKGDIVLNLSSQIMKYPRYKLILNRNHIDNYKFIYNSKEYILNKNFQDINNLEIPNIVNKWLSGNDPGWCVYKHNKNRASSWRLNLT